MLQHPLVLAGQYGSPYTLKMRAVLRYRRLPFRWVLRDSRWDDLPDVPVRLIPVIVFPDVSAAAAQGYEMGGDELVRVRVHHAQGSTLVVRITPDGHIEVHHQPDVGSGTTVRRIPLRDDATVVASDPPVEHTN